MGLDFKPRYIGPSPKSLLVTGALVLAAVFGTYAVMKTDEAPKHPTVSQVETIPAPVPPPPQPQ